MATVELSDVRKTYAGGVEAVKGVSLSVPDGALCVLVGPSGCGKSTLLRMIAGLESLSGGTIRIGDRAVDRLGPAERDIAMVFQNYALYPHMSVHDNMAYGLRNRKTPEAEIEARVREAARTLELEPLLKRLPRELSGGQRQRVAMGRAIVRQPSAFLFDEPLSNLDAKLRGQMRVEIKALQRKAAVTSIYVTHDQVEAMTMADMLVVMNGGRAEQVGSPLELYEQPASTFVAAFIGSPAMNMIPVEGVEGGLKLPDGHVLDAGRLGLAPVRGPALLGIRPEHFELAGDGGADFALDVVGVETLGADTLAHGRFSPRGRDTIVVRLPGSARPEPGQPLRLAVAPGAARLFETGTGRRLGR